jgi:hypothetical protein
MKREGVIVSICCFYINLGIESEAGSILSILGRILFVLVWLWNDFILLSSLIPSEYDCCPSSC